LGPEPERYTGLRDVSEEVLLTRWTDGKSDIAIYLIDRQRRAHIIRIWFLPPTLAKVNGWKQKWSLQQRELKRAKMMSFNFAAGR